MKLWEKPNSKMIAVRVYAVVGRSRYAANKHRIADSIN